MRFCFLRSPLKMRPARACPSNLEEDIGANVPFLLQAFFYFVAAPWRTTVCSISCIQMSKSTHARCFRGVFATIGQVCFYILFLLRPNHIFVAVNFLLALDGAYVLGYTARQNNHALVLPSNYLLRSPVFCHPLSPLLFFVFFGLLFNRNWNSSFCNSLLISSMPHQASA